MMKLLIPIDSSPVSKIVVDEVARRPWPSGTTACILHVIDWPQLPNSTLLLQVARQSANPFVKEASEKLNHADLQTSAKVLEGNPRIAVAQYANEWGADLVLVGARGVSGFVRFLLGSVAESVARHAPCSVEIVRARPIDDKRI